MLNRSIRPNGDEAGNLGAFSTQKKLGNCTGEIPEYSDNGVAVDEETHDIGDAVS
jgi:hypothetical protein